MKRAYRALSKEHHPDRNPGCGETCVEKMAAINQAKETIDSRGGGLSETAMTLRGSGTKSTECLLVAKRAPAKRLAPAHGSRFTSRRVGRLHRERLL